MAEQILVVDAGTTSTRAMLFDAANGAMLHSASRPLQQYYPQPGWVEHDAEEIWQSSLACMQEVATKAGGAQHIAAIGITNQRETVVAWDKQSGAPLARAIVWQDRRTAEFCEELRGAGHEDEVQARTGLLLDPYFSASKMRWLLLNDDAVAGAAERGALAFGTVESWLVYKLSGGAHISDASNASRTLLLPLTEPGFADGLCDLFAVPPASLPEVTDTSGALAICQAEWLGREVPISGMAGDQQAATIGHGCLSPGETKATYGTGAFVLTARGAEVPRSHHRLLATVLSQSAGQRHYALEGSVFVAGSLMQWLRDSLGLIASAGESEALARSVEDSGGVVIVPALAGLGAPYWRAEVRGNISGLSFASTKAHMVRAALESMAHQTYDLAKSFAADGAPWEVLKIDGGMSANDWMAQDIADLLAVTVERPHFIESSALGAGMLAAVGAGLYPKLEDAVPAMSAAKARFSPAMQAHIREERLSRWERAISALLA